MVTSKSFWLSKNTASPSNESLQRFLSFPTRSAFLSKILNSSFGLTEHDYDIDENSLICQAFIFLFVSSVRKNVDFFISNRRANYLDSVPCPWRIVRIPRGYFLLTPAELCLCPCLCPYLSLDRCIFRLATIPKCLVVGGFSETEPFYDCNKNNFFSRTRSGRTVLRSWKILQNRKKENNAKTTIRTENQTAYSR